MIAIGGAIGTGLFLGSASRLHSTGPALLLSYAFVGVIAYFLMRALGELVLHRPTSGAFVSYMREFFGEKAAFVTGWMYWLNWALTGIAELSAVGLYVQYWFPTDADLGDRADRAGRRAGHQPALGARVRRVRVLGVDRSRSAPSWSSWSSALVVVVGRLDIGGHEAGFHNLWSNPGGFWPTEDPYDWYGPILVMSGVVFAYAAIEMVGVAAGEMEDSETRGAQGRQRGHLPDRRLLLRLDPAAGLHAADHRVHRRAPARSSPSSSGWGWPG